MVKIASAAGAVLLVFVLYTKVIVPSSVPTDQDAGVNAIQPGQDLMTADSATAQDLGKEIDTQPERTETRRTAREKTPDESQVSNAAQQTSTPPPAPAVDLPSTETAQAVAATANVSSLSAQLIRVVRRDEGLQATVSFKNSASLPLSVVIDTDGGSRLTGQNGALDILDSDLRDFRLELPPGGSADHTFEFGMPPLGSDRFNLFLQADGQRVKVTGSATLEGSP